MNENATVLVGIYEMPRPVDERVVSEFERQVIPILQSNRVRVEGVFLAESVSNAFGRGPVQDREQLLVWFGVAHDGKRSPSWIHCLASMINLGDRRVSLLELQPTGRSIPGDGDNAVSANTLAPSDGTD